MPNLADSTCVSEESALAVAAIEDKIVGSDILIGEIEEQRGVDGDTEETSFEVEVRTKRASSVTTKTDELSGFYDFSNLSNALGEVTIDGFQTILVTNDNVVAIARSFVAYDAYFSFEGSDNGVASVDFDV